MKATLVQLLKFNIVENLDNFKHDIMLASKIFNPVFRNYNSNFEKHTNFNCLSRHSYSIESLFKIFSYHSVNLEEFENENERNAVLYTIFPLLIYEPLIKILRVENLFEPYELELLANKVFARDGRKRNVCYQTRAYENTSLS